MNKKILSLLSICKKAGKVISGDFSVQKAIQEGTAIYVIIADDASNNTKKKFTNKATYYNIKYVIYGQKLYLSHAIGALNRACFAITEEGFSKRLEQYIEEDTKENVEESVEENIEKDM